ncbi:hypothetical protein, partial [Laribacter hongkongensis]|uniref:hypothetical protein n=1 Tax=Laribacter hongkongensis TaxID=168471 RepID=UPI001EFCD8A7
MPIQLFVPWISDFWFVDKAYFTSKSALEEPPLLATAPLYRLLDVQVEGPALWNHCAPHITPCVRSETYRHEPSGRVVRIHRRRGYGFSALRKAVFGELGVFSTVVTAWVRAVAAIFGSSANMSVKCCAACRRG